MNSLSSCVPAANECSPQRESTLSAALNKMGTVQTQLAEELATLLQRIQPVCRPFPPEPCAPGKPDQKPCPSDSPLVERIAAHTGVLRNMVGVIRLHTNNLDL